jgi:hypothetical protein
MKYITIIDDTETLNQQWTSSEFTKVYSGPYTGTAIAINGDDPNKGLITLRSYIKDTKQLQESSQKFIIAIRFYLFGDMATIDVISLPKAYHKNIFAEHVKNMDWTYGQNESADSDKNYHAPFMCIGGHISLDRNHELEPHGASYDYGNDFCGSIAEDIAAYVLTACGLDVASGDVEKGAKCIHNIMNLMEAYKQQADFYERFLDHRTDLIGHTKIHPQAMSALTHMKAWDTSQAENIDLMVALAREISGGGLTSYAMLKGIQQRIRTTKELE